MGTARSPATGRDRSGRRAIWTGVLAAVAAIALVSGALVHPKSGASATTSDRHPLAAVAAVRTNSSAPVAIAPSAPAYGTVDLFGDSLGYQAEPYLDMFLGGAGKYTVSNNTFGGTATCDWLNKMTAAAAEHPRAAILIFSGNAFTPCMDGVALRSPAYYDLYTTDTEQAMAIFNAVGAHVFLVGTPIDETSLAGWNRLDDVYQQLAEADPLGVTYVDAGAAVESPSGRFTWELPCLSMEPSCGPNGANVVRSPDGIHFCPDGTPATLGVTGPCDEYSPGAFRFSLAVSSAVMQYQTLAPASFVHIMP